MKAALITLIIAEPLDGVNYVYVSYVDLYRSAVATGFRVSRNGLVQKYFRKQNALHRTDGDDDDDRLDTDG